MPKTKNQLAEQTNRPPWKKDKGQPANAFASDIYNCLYCDFIRRRKESNDRLSLTKYAEIINNQFKKNGKTILGRQAPPKRTSIITRLSNIDKLQAEPVARQQGVTYRCGHTIACKLVNELVGKWGYCLPIEEDCITCKTASTQVEDLHLAETYVRQRLSVTEDNVCVGWRDGNIADLDVGRILNKCCRIPGALLRDFAFARFCVAEARKFRWVDYDDMNPHVGQYDEDAGTKYNGAPQPEFVFKQNNLLSTPDDTGLGICYWKVEPRKVKKGGRRRGTHNFIVFDKLGIPFESIVKVSRKETVEMLAMNSTTRKGTAGGNHVPSHSRLYDTKSCSAATKETRVFVPSSTTNTAVVYVNHLNGRVAKFSQVSADVFMSELSSDAKRFMLQHDSVEREIALQEMRSRVRAAAIVHQLGLDVGESNKFLSIQKAIDKGCCQTVTKEWQDKIPGLSLWDVVLLELDCMSGESRLHQPSVYHTDGNDLDWCETYDTFPKIGMTDLSGGANSTNTIMNCPPANLVLVHQGFSARTRPGIDVLNINLDNTYHAAGNERGRSNYSKVKGSYRSKKK